MKSILLSGVLALSVLTLPGWCADTTILQTLTNPNGTPATGSAEILLSQACLTPNGTFVEPNPITVYFDGVFTVSLVPTDTCTPLSGSTAPFYAVSFNYDSNPLYVYQSWCVSTSSSPLSISTVMNACNGPGPGTLSLATLTDAQLSTLSNSQLLTLGN